MATNREFPTCWSQGLFDADRKKIIAGQILGGRTEKSRTRGAVCGWSIELWSYLFASERRGRRKRENHFNESRYDFGYYVMRSILAVHFFRESDRRIFDTRFVQLCAQRCERSSNQRPLWQDFIVLSQ